jgi:D-glycero-D-manno-heptose 1,7-bisphosphate phosphatase
MTVSRKRGAKPGAVTRERRPAAFLDRDGTIIEDREYLADPAGVALRPGAAAAIAALNADNIPVVVITNQSGIGRGYFTREQYDSVHARMLELLSTAGAHVDATYICPHAPDLVPPCACRKPGTLLYEQAVEEHALDPRRSLFAGDRWRDVEPGALLGGRMILIPSPATPSADLARADASDIVAPTLGAAVARFLGRDLQSGAQKGKLVR